MAKTNVKKSTNRKKVKKIVKKVKKAPLGTKVLLFFLFLIILALASFGGYKYYTVILTTNNEIDELISSIEDSFPKEIKEEISLVTKDEKYPNITITWESSDNSIINTTTNLVNQPSYMKGNQYVTLVATFHYEGANSLDNTIYETLNKDKKTFSIKVLVNSLPATDLEKVMLVASNLYVPDATFYSIGLPSSSPLFDDVQIIWESNSPYISNNGIVTMPFINSNANLIATIKAGDISKDYTFPITILNEDIFIEEVNESFDDNPNNSRYQTIEDSGITYTQSTIKTYPDFVPSSDLSETSEVTENFLRMRYSLESPATITSKVINNPKSFSFKYRYPDISDNHSTNKSHFEITIYNSDSDNTGVSLEPIDIISSIDDTFSTINIDLSSYENAKIEIKVIYGWQGSDYDFIDLEDVLFTKKISNDDLINWLTNNINTSISSSISLPHTTCFGGQISWVSSDQTKINNDGKLLVDIVSSDSITMTAYITYGTSNFTTTIDIKLKGKSTSTPVEIYFIDLGKYGASDCGEATYIKYGNIDILVDAGDAFDASKQAIEETLNSNMNDNIIEYVIATHPDADHIGGMPNIFEKYEVLNLYTFNGTHTSGKYTKYVNSYQNEGCNVFNIYDVVHQEDKDRFLYLDNDVYLEFIDTTYYGTEVSETNGRSIVFLLTAYDTKLLMTGDADNGTGHTDLERKYMNSVGNIDILKAVHHATSVGTTLEFLNVVDPEVVIVCNGNYLGNKHGHPHQDAINNVYQYDSKIPVYAICGGGITLGNLSSSNSYTTGSSGDERFVDRNGTIFLTIDDTGYMISSEYYQDSPLEFSSTTFWNIHPKKEYSYTK